VLNTEVKEIHFDLCKLMEFTCIYLRINIIIILLACISVHRYGTQGRVASSFKTFSENI
jgi:hypothetical protein